MFFGLRINDPDKPRIQQAQANPVDGGGGGGGGGGDEYLARLAKLIPSEVIAIYTAGKSYADSGHWEGIWSFVCLGLALLIRTLGSKQAGKPIQWAAVIVAAVSFVIWIYTLGSYFGPGVLPDTRNSLKTPTMLVWTFLVPFLYRGD